MQTICKAVGILGIECTFEQPAIDVVRQNFMTHLSENGISYGTKDEFEFRFQLFHKSDVKINEINNDPKLTFLAKHNQFSTLTADETKKYQGALPNKISDAEPTYLPTNATFEEVDWRKVGAVNPVQN